MITAAKRVTVVVVNFNSGDYLKKMLQALEQQVFNDFSVIVVDNASTDGSSDAVEASPLDVKLVALAENIGFAAANNLAVSMCASTYVALLNPDAFPEPGWLVELVGAADAHPTVAAFGSRQMMYGVDGVLDGTGDVYHCSGKVWRRRFGATMAASDAVPGEIFSPCAAAALYKKSVFEEAGGFDEDFFCYLEDVDLGFRLRLMGYSALYVPAAVVHHVGSGVTGGRRSSFSVYHGHRNLEWTYIKNMPGPLFWGFLPFHLAFCLFSLLYFSLQDCRSAIFAAKKDALAQLPVVWKKRKKIQSRRVVSAVQIMKQIDKRVWPSDRT